MKIYLKALLVKLLTLVFCVQTSWAQSIANSPLNSALYNGREYLASSSLVIGSPFFKNAEKVDGNSIFFDKILYENIPLLYDLKTDDLVTRNPRALSNTIIVKELVDFFTIGEDTIRYFQESNSGLKSGFYVQIYQSENQQSYAKYKKEVIEPKTPTDKRKYEEYVEYFYKSSEDLNFTSYKKASRLMPSDKKQKKEVNQMLKDKNLFYSGDLKQKTIAILSYLDLANKKN